jgi:Holliday junction DNA helicase RuvA
MIAKLTGVLDSVGPDWAVIDVHGVGYLTYCSARTLRHLGGIAAPVSLVVETHVREDHIHLYGFVDSAERDWFRRLITVQGVGSRVALSLLSVLAPDQLTLAVAAQDRAALIAADGVGPKLATRILSELKDKVGDLVVGAAAVAATPAEGVGATTDAVSALVNLGYRRAEAFGAIAAAAGRLGPGAEIEELIRAGLKELSP